MGQRTPTAPAPRSVALAAIFSFVWPGLGQWFQGRRRLAKLYALPLLPVVVLGLLLLSNGIESAALRLFDPTLALVVLVVVVLAAVWRLASLGHVVTTAGGPRRVPRLDLLVVVLLGVLVVETHAIVGNFAWSFYQAGTAIFDPVLPPATLPPGATPGLSAPPGSPLPTPATAESRINVLLIGLDSSSTRTHALTDTLIVASVDPVSGATSMVSIPRDVAEFPMIDGGTYGGKINSFSNWAETHPELFPDRGVPTLMREVGFLLGIPIHYYASVDLAGFVKIVDALGYVTVDNRRAIADPVYGGWTDGRPIGFFLSAGIHKLDGQEALAYARSRKGAGDSDFTRAARQQQLLSAVRARVADPALLPKLPAILAAVAETLRTNFPPDRLSEMLVLARKIDDAATRRVVLGPPYSVHPPTNTTGGIYILRLKLARIERLSAQLYGPDSAFWSPEASPAPSASPGP